MSEAAFAVLALLVLTWAVTSDLLARVNINGPMVFSVAGYVLANPDWGLLSVDVETPAIHLIAELTLALLLFSDAARVNLASLRRDLAFPARLLGIGLPLSVILGSLLAAWLFDDLSWALAGFVGATLAPTDAALSAPVINDPRIPDARTPGAERGERAQRRHRHTRRRLHPGAGGGRPSELPPTLTRPEAARWPTSPWGVAVGVAVGLGAAILVTIGSRRHWIIVGGRRLATLAAALSSFALAVAVGGNGFIAAFVAGIAFGAGADTKVVDVEHAVELPELLGEVMALVVWFLFGAVLVPLAVHSFSVEMLVYALLSLTLVRLAPVALALLGSGLDGGTVLFVGWFGPRGLASVVFALLAVEELGETPVVDLAVGAVALTVLLERGAPRDLRRPPGGSVRPARG